MGYVCFYLFIIVLCIQWIQYFFLLLIDRQNMQQGPIQLTKLPFPDKTHQIRSHPSLPYLLRISSQSVQNYHTQKQCIVRDLPLLQQPHTITHLNYSNKRLLYTSQNKLRINQSKTQIHNDTITHLLTDNSGLVLTAAQHQYDRSVKIVQSLGNQGPVIAQEFNFHYAPVTALYWRNSLGVSGDSSGQVCLWDVNKCLSLFHRKVHYFPVTHIGVYVDYTINNLFYTVSAEQKRAILSDLRTNKPIKILANLHSDAVVAVGNTPSGKIYIVYEDVIDIIDVHQQYRIIGNFSPILMDKMSQIKWTDKTFSYNNMRKFTHAKLMGRYLIVGCNNGNIQVYDTDTLECLYGFGLVKFGPIKNLECNFGEQTIFGLDAEGDVYMAKFQGYREDYSKKGKGGYH